jgi:molybdopterin-guanine dinucleotide biosynthesis protein A
LKGALVLAGGRSARFGRNKAFVKLGERPLFAHVIRAAAEVADEVFLSVVQEDFVAYYRKLVPEFVKIVKDRMPVKSPLVVMAAGLEQMKSQYSLALAYGTLFLNKQVLEMLFHKMRSDAAIPRWPNGDIEPLQAAYRIRTTLPAAKLALSHNCFQIRDMIERLSKVSYIRISDIRQVNAELVTFLNVNTPADLVRAKAVYR